ncbi:hypothetical protein FRC07_008963 [Ceratobasidium sp. 392]|nr:hypothetical protein FRC07_008963 [Ceratobasidium sp. 392]
MSIFMRKLPATVPAEQRLGTLFTNPGGPGGSGSQFAASVTAELFRTITEGKFDILEFDSRGVNLTQGWPFPASSDAVDREIVERFKAAQALNNAACVQNANKQILESLGTVSVVNNMTRMLEALGEDGMYYWGISYGSSLGATFAAVYPDLVKRWALDGILDSEKAGLPRAWRLQKLTCLSYPGSYWILIHENQTTQTLRKQLDERINRLAKRPVIVADSPIGPGIYKATALQSDLLGALYSPAVWPTTMKGLAELQSGNATSMYVNGYQTFFSPDVPYEQNVYICSMQTIGKVSPLGESWAVPLGGCNGWSFRANQRYTGLWSVKDGMKKPKFPLLLAAMTGDPVTPVQAAGNVSRDFGRDSASLLLTEGISHPSKCTFKHIRDYLIDGVVPKNGTTCTAE